MGTFGNFTSDVNQWNVPIPSSATGGSPWDILRTYIQRESYTFGFSSVTVNTNSTGQTNIINQGAEVGKVMSLAIATTTALVGAVTANIEFEIDGGSQTTISLFSNNANWAGAIQPFTMIAGTPGTPGATLGDTLCIPLGFNYRDSVRVSIDISAAGTSGQIRATLIRGIRAVG